MSKLRDFLWSIWIPEYEGGGPWHLRWRAHVMYWVRHAWFRGKARPCSCPGCAESVLLASASGMCCDCLNVDCQHEPADECATCHELNPSVWPNDDGSGWFCGCGCGEVWGEAQDAAVEAWNLRQAQARADTMPGKGSRPS